MRKRANSFSSRIMLHMSIIIMLAFAVSGYLSYRINNNLFTEEISRQFGKANEQAAARIDLQLRDIYRISNFIVFHPYIEQVLRRSGESDVRESDTQITDQDELNQLLFQVKNDENKLYSMFLYDMKDNSYFFHVSPTARSTLDRDIYEQVKTLLDGTMGNLVWFPIQLPSAVEESGYRDFYAAARYMKNKDLEQYGTMIMLFDESLFSEDLNELVSDENANVYLFDRQDRLVYTDRTGEEAGSTPVPSRLAGSQIVKENGSSYLYVQSRSRLMDFSLISRVSLEALKQKSTIILKISLLVGVVGVLLAATLVSWSGRRLFRPLTQLVRGMRRMREGNLQARVEVDTSDELAYIGQSFNSMAENLEQLIREVYERQLSEREAELTALQTQLNPHFLQNTLDTIYWKLYLQDDRATAGLVVSLSEMLRYALEPADTETTLSAELAQIRNYLKIQSARHGNELDTVIQMGAGTELAKVPRLIIQPLVENAFVHAFADKRTERVLIIQTSLVPGPGAGQEDKREALLIEIIDNGRGMEDDAVRKVVSDALAPRSDKREESGPIVGGKRVHIGIRSVLRRLNLLYGEPYGLTIEATPGSGTTVRLLLPMHKEGTDL
ncbi:sensor histidine kinase [Cohnella fermenti]|uniref:HAMP domain-containing protein n=1 Tax=Cohnella fermenti TaxID=2565925 RepID=A0A4S4BTT4_9BACL|nr:sensor histidine kinase [Cohnella fermenti]THF77740.1 HAMP domain-containing protein [Cohnella fermenti]